MSYDRDEYEYFWLGLNKFGKEDILEEEMEKFQEYVDKYGFWFASNPRQEKIAEILC